jgi:hypothetical protein
MTGGQAYTPWVDEEEVSWDEFIRKVQLDPRRHHCKWRGVKNYLYPLSSSFQRKVVARLSPGRRDLGVIESLQSKLHRYYSLAIRGMRGDHPSRLDYNQVWAMGRHYGLNTPYLDWSNSPFLAAFFAVFDLIEDFVNEGRIIPDLARFGTDGASPLPAGAKFAIYQLELTGELFPWVSPEDQRQECEKRDRERRANHDRRQGNQPTVVETWNPFLCDTTSNMRRFRPPSAPLDGEFLLFLDVNVEELRRMQGQRGYFTALHSARCLSIESFLRAHGAEACLKKYCIPVTELRHAFEHLSSHGIDYQLIYPDLDGAAKQANLLCDMDLFHDAEARARVSGTVATATATTTGEGTSA